MYFIDDFSGKSRIFTHPSQITAIISLYLIRVLGKVTFFKEKIEYEEHCFNSAEAEAIR